MKVSIVIPVYNDPRIATALDSIKSQKCDAEIEVVIVDGGSKDNTVNVVKSYGNLITTLISEPDKGLFDAINKGVKASTGDVIALLGSDDRYADASVVQDSVTALGDPEVDASYGDLVYVDDADKITRYWKSGLFKRYKIYLGWLPPHFTLFARRKVYDDVGEFDITKRVAADSDWLLRMMYEHRVRLRYIRRVLVRMTEGGNSNRSWRAIATGNMEAFQAWRRYNRARGLLVPILKPASKLIQLIRRPPTQ